MQIKVHTKNTPPAPFQLFILSKGLNSGKPLQNACPNCFVITCGSQQEQNFYYCICFALWKSKKFRWYLTGSVIEFLRISDFKKIVADTARQLDNNAAGFFAAVDQVKAIEEKEKNVLQQLQLLGKLKIAMLQQFL